MKLNASLLLSLICRVWSLPTCAAPVSTCSVKTSSGTLKGVCYGDNAQFLGIRYAQAPEGDLRFAPAQDYSASPTAGTVQATALPPSCPQLSQGDELSVTSLTEDCLFLNVYMPSSALAPAGGQPGPDSLPVLFWIYGGTFLEGSSADPTFNGTKLASNANAVVVTFNYRLGVLGFYDSDETGTNFALSDAQSALRWVRANAQAFGADPNRVTIVGESSGATLVRALTVSPQSNHLFARAIMQSDPQTYGFTDETVAKEGIAGYVKTATNCTTLKCLRSVSVADLLNVTYNVYNELDSIPGANAVYPWGPNLDGPTLPTDFAVAASMGDTQSFAQSTINGTSLDFLMGSLAHEAGPTISSMLGNDGISYPGFLQVLSAELTDQGAQFLQSANVYNINSTATPLQYEYLLDQIGTDYEFLCPMQYNAQSLSFGNKVAQSVYFYHIAAGLHYPDNDGLLICDGGSSACHQDDLYALFGTSPAQLTADQSAFSTEMQRRWGAFAATGNPNVNGYPQWNKASSSGSNLNVLVWGTGVAESSSMSTPPLVHPDPCGFFGTEFPYMWQQ